MIWSEPATVGPRENVGKEMRQIRYLGGESDIYKVGMFLE